MKEKEPETFGLTEEEIKEKLRKQNQHGSKVGPTRGGRSSGQGVKLLYIRDYLYAYATKEHPKNAKAIKDYFLFFVHQKASVAGNADPGVPAVLPEKFQLLRRIRKP